MAVCVIFNPAAKGDQARHLRQQLQTLGAEATLKPTPLAGAARSLAADAVAEGFDTIVAAGGDGTLNEVLNGLNDAPGGFERVRLGVLPLGTVNVFARELGLSANLAAAWQTIRQGNERIIDVLHAEWTAEGQPQRRAFIQLAGAGVDARAVELLQWDLKKRMGILAYLHAAWLALREPRSRIEVTGEGIAIVGEQVAVGNGRYYGGKYRLFPQARLDDGWFDVSVIERADWPTLFRGMWGMCSGRLAHQAGWRVFQAQRLTLTSETKAAFELDGEWVGNLPVTFTLLPQRLRVLIRRDPKGESGWGTAGA